MDAGDVVGPRQHQQIAVALEIAADGPLKRAPRNSFVGQLQALDHRAHGAVEDEDALGEQLWSVESVRSHCRWAIGVM